MELFQIVYNSEYRTYFNLLRISSLKPYKPNKDLQAHITGLISQQALNSS